MRRLAAMVLTCAACSTPASKPVPGAMLGPRLARPPAAACGNDIAFDESSPVALRYRYVYDDVGQLAHAYGTYTGRGAPVSEDYAWDNLGHLVQVTDAQGTQAPVIAMTALYNTLGDLVEYNASGEHYTYGAFDEDGHPTTERVESGRASMTYQLAYDNTGRLSRVTTDAGDLQVYVYDDAAHTLTIDSGSGAFHGIVRYDEENRELSESWDGTDPAAIAREDQYHWSDTRLVSYTRREGTPAAPHELRTVEVDTYRFDCGTP